MGPIWPVGGDEGPLYALHGWQRSDESEGKDGRKKLMAEQLLAAASRVLTGLMTHGTFGTRRVVSIDGSELGAKDEAARNQAIVESVALARELQQEIERQGNQ